MTHPQDTTSEVVAQPQFDGLPKRKLDDLISRGWDISGYSIHKDGEHGLVTVGGFVGWFTVAERNATTAETQLAALTKRVGELEGALEPFADAVFNDNGDITVSHGVPTSEDFIRAYFALRAARRLLTLQEQS